MLRLFFFSADPVLPFLNSLYRFYLHIPEYLANNFFKYSEAGVRILDHKLVFVNGEDYKPMYRDFVASWTQHLAYKRFSALLLVVIWFNSTAIRKKLLFTLIFLFTHLISVLGGLILLGLILPIENGFGAAYFLSPTIFGTFTFFSLFVTWVLYTKKDIVNLPKKLGFRITISENRLYEFLILLFFFLLLRNILIPFIAFKPYVFFLLEITREIASFINYEGYIIGDQLFGSYGSLALSKHCLGFMSMYLFAGLVFITRQKSTRRFTLKFIVSGLSIIFVLNIFRLLFVFIVVQGIDGYRKASLHHEIYNVVIYIFIFLLWVVWFEKNRSREQNKNI